MGTTPSVTERHREYEVRRRERAITLAREADYMYQKVQRMALLRHFWCRLRGKPHDLPKGEELLAHAIPLAVAVSGVVHIPLRQIIGSEDRGEDFDCTFAPLQRHTRERWCRVALAWLEGTALEPVQLIQVGNFYFVRDGHHRVSVARAFGAVTLEAVVVRCFAVATSVQWVGVVE
ncbi:hypothetical protein [Candidatus Oscillochloris fontis]|uniref:hypothetical protein n=1 Tax=Candidatus Oscillochloris fontis TaxID=2496868 RepID=UPI00101CC79D|nr:hypothetical protein [Candidatus Oscillochloris fontis]